MAGHSKWANIKHKKANIDLKRGKIWTRLIREITVASRIGGSDPASNSRLRLAYDKATDANMPKDTIQKAIARGIGDENNENFEKVRYEGYGPFSVAIIIDCLTDNKKRTVSELRHILNKHGGNLGQDGSVSFQFTHCGEFFYAPGQSSEKLLEILIEHSTDSDLIELNDGGIEIICPPKNYLTLKNILEKTIGSADSASLTFRPTNEVSLNGEEANLVKKLIECVEDLDDVQDVYTNAIYE